MGIFNIQELISFINSTDIIFNTIVETGTLFGDSTKIMAKFFKNVKTIELSSDLYNNAKLNLSKYLNIECICGDSATILKTLCPKIKTNTVFFLDAHWSGNSKVDWKNSIWNGYGIDTACKNNNPLDPINQVPLHEEILSIVNNFKENAIIYIDDMDKFYNNKGLKNKCFIGEDWSHLDFEKILLSLNSRIKNIKFINNNSQVFILLDKQ